MATLITPEEQALFRATHDTATTSVADINFQRLGRVAGVQTPLRTPNSSTPLRTPSVVRFRDPVVSSECSPVECEMCKVDLFVQPHETEQAKKEAREEGFTRSFVTRRYTGHKNPRGRQHSCRCRFDPSTLAHSQIGAGPGVEVRNNRQKLWVLPPRPLPVAAFDTPDPNVALFTSLSLSPTASQNLAFAEHPAARPRSHPSTPCQRMPSSTTPSPGFRQRPPVAPPPPGQTGFRDAPASLSNKVAALMWRPVTSGRGL